MSDGSVYNGKPLTMAWQSADGVLSPKIVIPPRNSLSRSRTLSTGKSPAGTGDVAAGTDEPARSRKTSINKLLDVGFYYIITVD